MTLTPKSAGRDSLGEGHFSWAGGCTVLAGRRDEDEVRAGL